MKVERLVKGRIAVACVVLSMLVVVMFGVNCDDSSTGETSGDNVVEGKIGEAVTAPKAEVTIVKVSTRKRINGPFDVSEPAEGGIYVCVDYKYKNVMDKPMDMFSTPTFKLMDSKGNLYDTDTGASSDYASMRNFSEKGLSDLNPGLSVTGGDVFEIAKEIYDAGGFSVYVTGAGKNIKVPIE